VAVQQDLTPAASAQLARPRLLTIRRRAFGGERDHSAPLTVDLQLAVTVGELHFANDCPRTTLRTARFRVVGQAPVAFERVVIELQEPEVRKSRIVLTVIVVPVNSSTVQRNGTSADRAGTSVQARQYRDGVLVWPSLPGLEKTGGTGPTVGRRRCIHRCVVRANELRFCCRARRAWAPTAAKAC
jgi:hypothetical protein